MTDEEIIIALLVQLEKAKRHGNKAGAKLFKYLIEKLSNDIMTS